MTFAFNIPFISLFLAMLSAIASPLLKKKDWALNLTRWVQLAIAALSALLLVELTRTGESFTFMMGHFPAPWGNELKAGPLEALLALAFSLVMVLSMTGGADDIRRDIPAENQGKYCLLMQLLYASLLAMVYTNDLFTAYVFIEIAAITACIAVVAKESGKSVVASIRYLVFSCLGSGLVLLGISILYSITGNLLMESLHTAIAALVKNGTYLLPLTASVLLMTLGLSIKSAQFPFHAWLPDAHANATTSASAILSGLVLKGYIVLLVKLIIRVFGETLISNLYMNDLLFLLGLAGMLFASVAAMRQEDVKRMVAYSSSAQISYIFMALGLGTRAGVAAACFQVLAHAFTKPMIFVGTGAIIRESGGGHYWRDLRGAAWKNPLAGLAFTIGGLSLCGIPLLAGFSAKYNLAIAALGADWQTLPALFGLAASSLLNAMYYIPAILVIWSQNKDAQPTVKQDTYRSWELYIAIGCFLVFNVVLGTAIEPIFNVIYQGLALL